MLKEGVKLKPSALRPESLLLGLPSPVDDDEHKGELITTLQMYLRNKQSIRKTADAMFVHYRTISYRLEKIKQISGINFDNANEVLAVSNGLIIYKMLKEIE